MWIDFVISVFLHEQADDNEWKVRFESQQTMNKHLQEHKEWLEAELADARRKLTTGRLNWQAFFFLFYV